MGLEKQEGRKIFLNISDGKIVRQHQNPIEGTTVTRTNKNSKVVHEEFFKAVTGIITDIKSKETPFGMVWEISVQDGDEDFVVSFNYSSRYTNHFFRALPNADLSQPLSIHPWSMKDKKDPSKQAIGLSLYQNKEKLEFAYTKEEPGDMPDLKQTKVKGKIQWDDSDQLEFFEKLVKKLMGGRPVVKAVLAQEITVPLDDKDMPF